MELLLVLHPTRRGCSAALLLGASPASCCALSTLGLPVCVPHTEVLMLSSKHCMHHISSRSTHCWIHHPEIPHPAQLLGIGIYLLSDPLCSDL